MGTALFARHGPKISLTAEGEQLLDLALPHLEAIHNLHETFNQQLQSHKKTELRIAANSTTLNFVLPSLVKHYLAANSDIYITIHYSEHEEAMEKLKRDEVDFALLPRRDHMPFPGGCRYIPMFTTSRR